MAAFLVTFLAAFLADGAAFFLAAFLADFLGATFFFAMGLFGVTGTGIQFSHYSKLGLCSQKQEGTVLEVIGEVKDFWPRSVFFADQ